MLRGFNGKRSKKRMSMYKSFYENDQAKKETSQIDSLKKAAMDILDRENELDATKENKFVPFQPSVDDGKALESSGNKSLSGRQTEDNNDVGPAQHIFVPAPLPEDSSLRLDEEPDSTNKRGSTGKKATKLLSGKKVKKHRVSENYVKMDLRRNFRRGAQGKTPAARFKKERKRQRKRGGYILDKDLNVSDVEDYVNGIDGDQNDDKFRVPEEQVDNDVWNIDDMALQVPECLEDIKKQVGFLPDEQTQTTTALSTIRDESKTEARLAQDDWLEEMEDNMFDDEVKNDDQKMETPADPKSFSLATVAEEATAATVSVTHSAVSATASAMRTTTLSTSSACPASSKQTETKETSVDMDVSPSSMSIKDDDPRKRTNAVTAAAKKKGKGQKKVQRVQNKTQLPTRKTKPVGESGVREIGRSTRRTSSRISQQNEGNKRRRVVDNDDDDDDDDDYDDYDDHDDNDESDDDDDDRVQDKDFSCSDYEGDNDDDEDENNLDENGSDNEEVFNMHEINDSVVVNEEELSGDDDKPLKRSYTKRTKKATTTTKTTRSRKNTKTTNEDKETIEDVPIEKTTRKRKVAPKSFSNLESALQHVYGFSTFRPGQKLAIQRIMNLQSTIVVQPTGAGKSLCYQLPAYLHSLDNDSIAIVVCPLISLMDDQFKRLPKSIPGAVLNSSKTAAQEKKILDGIRNRIIKVLFVSPELIISEKFKLLVRGKQWLRNKYVDVVPFPPISFVCVDEAHCVSEWSHNFRPSYFRLGLCIQENLGVSCILSLTATATIKTLAAIMNTFNVANDGIIRGNMIPRNLHLSVSHEKNRLSALHNWLNLPHLTHNNKPGSVIVYCTRRLQTEQVAKHLIDQGLDAQAYHAGLTPAARRQIQFKFMSGSLRIICATIAFGMGLNKPDIRGVVHFNMPKSLENYVQEVGRAGRDGAPAYGHLFYDDKDRDWLDSRIYADSISEDAVESFVFEIFQVGRTFPRPDERDVVLSIEKTTQSLDISEAAIFTLLCKLEFCDDHFITKHANTDASCTLRMMPSARAKIDDDPNARFLSNVLMHSNNVGNEYKFQISEMAEKLSMNVLEFIKALKINCANARIARDSSNKSWCYRINADVDDIPSLSAKIQKNLRSLEKEQRQKLSAMFQIGQYCKGDIRDLFHDFAKKERLEMDQFIKNKICTYFDSLEGKEETEEHQTSLLSKNLDKFNGIETSDVSYLDEKLYPDKPVQLSYSKSDLSHARSEMRALVSQNKTLRNGYAVAKILHGLGSPCQLAQHWYQHRAWRKFIHVDFEVLSKIAEEEITKVL